MPHNKTPLFARLGLLVLAQALATAAFAAPCAPSVTTLCLSGGRFQVDVQWKDAKGRTGAGQAVPITADTGDFWFFSPANVELVVKVLDARAVNHNYWVFYGALSNVEYTMTVTDTATNRVKTYANPQGQFASVGDTKAFSGSSATTTSMSSRMDVEGFTPDVEELEALQESTLLPINEADTAPTPCAGASTDLGLNGCRFRLSVAWKDSKGRTGVGQPVPLTNDTGYFWFFAPANIELVIKVLDARSVNGNFWVFYGALSNVEYTLTVTDTLTGAVNTYSNPAGRFASVGDTKAFHPGYSVAAHVDASRAVSKVIAPEGGTLSATAADGTAFSLTVPAGALLSEEKITMSPVASVDRLPLSGGLAAAVQLGPEGLLLFQPATLVIQTPAPISSAEEITFAWRGSGDEFSLYPPDPVATPAVSLSLMHFSAYGVGRGSSADRSAQQGRQPSNATDRLAQNLEEAASEQRNAARAGQSPSRSEATALLTDYLNDLLLPSEPKTCSDDAESYLVRLAWFRKQVLSLTGPDQVLLDDAQRSLQRVLDLLASCYEEADARCQTDPNEGEEMLRIYEILKGAQQESRVDRARISKCLTFELDFSSFVQEATFPGATFAFRHQVGAIVPGIIFSPFADDPHAILPAELKYLTADYTGILGNIFGPDCSMKIVGSSSIFKVSKMTLDVNAFEGNGHPPDELTVEYDPGLPQFTFTLYCGGAPPVTIGEPRWQEIYQAHRGGSAPPFLAEDWLTLDLSSGIYATKSYDQTDALGHETSSLSLKHTPQ